MLVLTRKRGEKLLIGDDIVITIIETRGDGVRIGIEAPQGKRIQRQEVAEAIEAANREAAVVGETDASRLSALLSKMPTAPHSTAPTSAQQSSADLPPSD